METLRSRIIALVAIAGLAAAAVPAAADGPGRSRDYYPTWQGLYAGVHIGYGELDPLEGFAGGGLIGYNWQKGQIVYGWEADFSISDISWEFVSVDWLATVRGRLGYLVHPNLLAYATAGLGYAEVSVPCCFGIDESGTDFVFGVGLEGKLNEASTLRVEYLNHGDLDLFRAALTFKLGN